MSVCSLNRYGQVFISLAYALRWQIWKLIGIPQMRDILITSVSEGNIGSKNSSSSDVGNGSSSHDFGALFIMTVHTKSIETGSNASNGCHWNSVSKQHVNDKIIEIVLSSFSLMVSTLSWKKFENRSGSRSAGEKVVGSGVHLFLDISLLIITKSSLQLELSVI